MKLAKSLILVLLAGIPLAVVCSPSSDRNSTVHVVFNVEDPDKGVFPSDAFTVADDSQKTGLRVNLPMPDCRVRVSDCADLAFINVLDGFNLQPRMTVPFDGDIDPQSVNNANAFFLELADADINVSFNGRLNTVPRVIGVNQLVWDAPTHVLAAQSDEQLRQHTRYAFVITTGLLDTFGAPVRASDGLDRFRHDLNFGQTHDPVLEAYRKSMLDAFATLRMFGISEEQVAGLSVFTTQSATAVLEHIRDQIKATNPDPMSFNLAASGTRTVFPVSSIQNIDWQIHLGGNPPVIKPFASAGGFYLYLPFPPPQYFRLLDLYSPAAVSSIAYGSYRSPRYIFDEPVMPAVGTLAGTPPVQSVDTIYVNFFVPAGQKPAAGWPVVIFGLGGGDYKDEEVYLYAAAFGARGMATACINVNGQGYGPLSYLTVTLTDGSSVRFRSGGRSVDIDADGDIKDNEGFRLLATRTRFSGRVTPYARQLSTTCN
jgi:hypothetical protein